MSTSALLPTSEPEAADHHARLSQPAEAIKALQRQAATVAEAQLPAGADFHYHHSTSSQFASAVAAIQQQTQELLTACQGVLPPSSQASIPPAWTNADELQEWTAALLAEMTSAVDTALDRHQRGEVQQAIPGNSTQGVAADIAQGTSKKQGFFKEQAPSLPKPQAKFKQPVDNSSAPFRHWAQHLEALGAQQPPVVDTDGASLTQPNSTAQAGEAAVDGPSAVAQTVEQVVPLDHPFRQQLQELTHQACQLEAHEPIAPRALEETPLHWVDTPEALKEMAAALSTCSHIAVDLEHHDFRSFQGITCLMQMSSRDTDWVVDTLALREHLGPALAAVMANPAIVKVLHGSDRDVLWLQRDFHLYIVNMFDTGQAARVLSLPSASLAYLLEHYCGVAADKRFQLADWRVRPLSQEMMDYARGDTHYLLYVHDRLKQQLHELGDKVPPTLLVDLPAHLTTMIASEGEHTPTVSLALATVLERSRRITAHLYRKEVCTAATAEELLLKWQVPLAPVQRAVFTALLMWRDKVCREEDEGTGYVLPRAQLLTLSKNMPGNIKDMLRQAGNASEPLRRRAAEVVACINQAKNSVLVAPDSAAAAAARGGGVDDANAQPVSTGAVANQGAGLQSNLQGAGTHTQLQPAAVSRIQRKGGPMSAMPSSVPIPSQAQAEPAAGVPKAAVAGADQPAPFQQALDTQPQVVSSLALDTTVIAPVVVPRKPLAKKSSAFAAALSQQASVAAAAPGSCQRTGMVQLPTQLPDIQADAAAQVAQQLRASFVLPFSTTPQQAQNGSAGGAVDRTQAQGPANDSATGAEEVAAAGAKDDKEGDDRAVPTSGSEIRALVDQMQAAGPAEDIVLDSDGQAMAEGVSRQEMDQDDVQAEGQGDGQGEGAVPGHDGQEVGLPGLEFVPFSLKEMKHQQRQMAKAAAGNDSARCRRATTSSQQDPSMDIQPDGNAGQEASSWDKQQRPAKKPKYSTAVAADADAAAKAAEKAVNKLFDSEEEEDGESSESEMEGGETAPEVDAAQPEMAQQFKQARKRAHDQAVAEAAGGRGRGRGQGRGRDSAQRGRGGAARGRGGRGQERAPAFNPYHIPDEHLVKAGKRTTVMPRSGNRTATFKK